ncbi:methyltransferase family [Chlorella sorokiniana]|uniref:Methyltransferase family n=1 Tax=Chlorella sorokiniana TaxID=3076 RepID=A0A2P6U3H7_CHLSO|nr:methyltransferase family [Chlorella sorokiniana]|eukprot:PRW60868.1 methyltransferase family [Chlorella sorokiniana]
MDAGQAILLALLQPAAPLLPPDAEHRRRLLRAVVLAAEADGQEVDEQLMQLYSECLLGAPQPVEDTADCEPSSSSDSSVQALLPPPPQPGWCYKAWCYAPAWEAPAASLAAVEALEQAVAKQHHAWLAQHETAAQQGQQQQAGALPRCPPAAAGDGSRGLLALHVSMNLLEGGTGCHEWEAGFYLSEWVLNKPTLVAGRVCLEIGCGAGMVGVALHRAGAAHVLCTDGDAQTVANCRFNLQLNGVPLAAGSVIPTLLSLLKQVLAAGAGAAVGLCSQGQWQADPQLGDPQQAQQQAQQQQPAAYLATTLRNEATLQQFLVAVEADPAIRMQQLAGPPVPGTGNGSSATALLSSESSSPEPVADRATAGAGLAACSIADEPDGGCCIRWQHLPELDAARERIFLHRITLAA